jgi:hypothetical protein
VLTGDATNTKFMPLIWLDQGLNLHYITLEASASTIHYRCSLFITNTEDEDVFVDGNKCRLVYHITDCYIFNTVISCKTHANKYIMCTKKLTKSVGSCTTWFIRKLWVRTPLLAMFIRYNIMWKSVLVACDMLVVFSGLSGVLH